MAFFDDLSKRVSQGTKTFTETAKLNSLINENRKKIERLYTSLGQAYYEAHKSDPAAEKPELLEELNGLFQGIAQAEQELNELKMRGKCPGCGAEVPQGALFCASCGMKQPQPEPPAAPAGFRFCPGCGAQVNAGNKFCNLCGTPLEQPVRPPVQTPTAPAEAVPQPEKEPTE